jgi:hypothetical protein
VNRSFETLHAVKYSRCASLNSVPLARSAGTPNARGEAERVRVERDSDSLGADRRIPEREDVGVRGRTGSGRVTEQCERGRAAAECEAARDKAATCGNAPLKRIGC